MNVQHHRKQDHKYQSSSLNTSVINENQSRCYKHFANNFDVGKLSGKYGVNIKAVDKDPIYPLEVLISQVFGTDDINYSVDTSADTPN